MKTLGNIIWFLLVGFWSGIIWCFWGLLWSITIIGLPVGKQCFKIAKLTFFPFGKVVRGNASSHIILNLLWIVFGGIELAVWYAFSGIVLCITIIGIPFGKQCFKLAGLALMPFGVRV